MHLTISLQCILLYTRVNLTCLLYLLYLIHFKTKHSKDFSKNYSWSFRGFREFKLRVFSHRRTTRYITLVAEYWFNHIASNFLPHIKRMIEHWRLKTTSPVTLYCLQYLSVENLSLPGVCRYSLWVHLTVQYLLFSHSHRTSQCSKSVLQ